jgi:aryl-alcohol dehydrogenase-like predicted oxidoreductase
MKRFIPNAFGISRRNFLLKGTIAAASIPLISLGNVNVRKPSPVIPSPAIAPVWRNKQSGMAYRQLGRTGFMVSEIVNGGNHVSPDNLRPTELAVEMGLNYLDTASGYGGGNSELGIGKFLSKASNRDKIFINTKVSGYHQLRNSLYKDIFDGLSAGKKEALLKKAKNLRAESGVDQPEYYVAYFPSQPRLLDGVFLSRAMMSEYGEKVDGSRQLEELITSSLEQSLKRMNTDYVDILMCPHGSSDYNEVNSPYIVRTFEKLKKQGKVRHLGVSTHNNMGNVLKGAMDSGSFDVIMLAYNLINHGFLDNLIQEASNKGMGIIAMKVARPFIDRTESFRAPAWRIEKLNHFVKEDVKIQQKAYLWALQNPNISAVISDMQNEDIVAENLPLAGRSIKIGQA